MKSWMSSLHAHLMLSLSFGWVLLVCVLLGTSWYLGRDVTRHSLLSQLEFQSEMLARSIEQDIEVRTDTLVRLAEQFSAAELEEPATLRQRLAANEALLSFFDALILINAEGRVVADWPQLPDRDQLDVTHRDFFVRAKGGLRPLVSDPYMGRVTTEPLVMLATPLLDDEGQFLGVLGGAKRVLGDNFLGFLQRHRLGISGFVAVGTSDGQVLVHPERELIMQPLPGDGFNPMIEKALLGWEGSGESELITGGRALQAYNQIWSADWVVGVYVPEEEAYAAFDRLWWSLWIIGGVVIALSLPVLWWLLQLLLLPVQRFANQIESITRGDRERLDAQTSLIELRSVAYRFNALLDSRELIQEDLEKRQAYLRAVLDSSPVGLFLSDLKGSCIYANRAYQEMTGYSSDKLLGLEWSRYAVYSEDRPHLMAGWQLALQTGEDFRSSYRCITADEHIIWLDVHSSAINDQEGRLLGYIGTLRDVTASKKQEQADRWAALHDGLTHLRNRRGFDEAIQHSFAQKDKAGQEAVLLLIDLDHFKPINDTLGHDVGDLWLIKIAEILQQFAGDKGVAARQGGDEFALLLPQHSLEEAVQIAEKVRLAVADLVIAESEGFQVTASIGVASLSSDDQDVRAWIKRADEACYQAKSNGRNTLVVQDLQPKMG